MCTSQLHVSVMSSQENTVNGEMYMLEYKSLPHTHS